MSQEQQAFCALAKTAKKKSPKQSINDKLDALLDKLPAFLDNANKAAAAHQKALVKFERKQGLVDSDDTSSEDLNRKA